MGAAFPLDTVNFENLDTHESLRMVLTSSFNTSHPDMITAAAAGGTTSLSLPILRLKPGRYRIAALEFVGGGTSN